MKKIFLSICTLSLALISCDKEEPTPATTPIEKAKEAAISNYVNIVYASYEDSYNGAVSLKSKIDLFVADPTASNFDDVKSEWLASRESYGQTEVYRFGNGPIDDADGPEGLINAWPLDESYIDYTATNAASGIVNDLSKTIDRATLESLNEQGGEENVTLGYHAIEFLLWGQDDADVSLLTPGNRPYTDFVDGGTASNQSRRRAYLQIAGELLVEHINSVKSEWSTSGAYRTSFLALTTSDAISKIFSGMGILSKSELAGERIFTALNNLDQEDEHSCFADNTHRDIILNAQGIYNVYNGIYERTDGSIITGTSFSDVVKMADTAVDADLIALLDASQTNVNNIPAPFDNALTQESVGGTGPIMTAIIGLQNQGDMIAQAAAALGVTVSTDLPG
jgi:putative iron-regulated protein